MRNEFLDYGLMHSPEMTLVIKRVVRKTSRTMRNAQLRSMAAATRRQRNVVVISTEGAKRRSGEIYQ